MIDHIFKKIGIAEALQPLHFLSEPSKVNFMSP